MTILKHMINVYSKLEKWEDLVVICKRILILDKSNTKAQGLLVKTNKEKNKFMIGQAQHS